MVCVGHHFKDACLGEVGDCFRAAKVLFAEKQESTGPWAKGFFSTLLAEAILLLLIIL